MSEDIQNGGVAASESNSEAPVYTDIEQRAMELGWVPKDEYTGDPQRWKTAEVFVALDEPIKRIEKQSGELKAVRKALEAMQQHYSKVRETEYNRALADLKQARKQAFIDGDLDRVEVIEDKIDEFKQEAATIKQAARLEIEPEPTVAPEFQSWLNKNPWYSSYKHMAAFADELGLKLHNQGLSKQEVLKRVEDEVRKEFPNKFINPNKEKPSAVEGSGSKRSAGGKSSGDFELTETERNIMNTLVRSKTMTKEEYIADLRKVKGLE